MIFFNYSGGSMSKDINEQPLYMRVKDMILEKIKNDNLQPGDSLPTEPELEEMFHVSRTTIRAAINELKSEGYVVKQQGRGTFVANNSYEECVALLQSFSEDAKKNGSIVKTVVLGVDLIVPDDELVNLLEIEQENLLRLERIRYVDGEIVNVTTAYLPKRVHEKLDWKKIDFNNTTLYVEMRNSGIDLESGEEVIEVLCADERLASLLHVNVGSALVNNRRKVYNRLGQLVEYSTTYTRGDKYRNYVKLKRTMNGL